MDPVGLKQRQEETLLVIIWLVIRFTFNVPGSHEIIQHYNWVVLETTKTQVFFCDMNIEVIFLLVKGFGIFMSEWVKFITQTSPKHIPWASTTIKTMGVNITTIAYQNVLIIEIWEKSLF